MPGICLGKLDPPGEDRVTMTLRMTYFLLVVLRRSGRLVVQSLLRPMQEFLADGVSRVVTEQGRLVATAERGGERRILVWSLLSAEDSFRRRRWFRRLRGGRQ